MISTNYSSNYSPSFGQVNVVRVAKNAFKNPEDVIECSVEFGKALDKASGNKEGLLDLVYALIGRKDKVKTVHNLEGGFGVKYVDVPLEEDVHTFSVLTGEEKDEVSNLFSMKNIIKMAKTVKDDGVEIRPMDVICEKVKEICSNKQVIEFRLENLDKLVELKSKLGL